MRSNERRIVLVQNPKSSNFEAVYRASQEVYAAFRHGQVIPLPTRSANIEDNIEDLAEGIEDGDEVVAMGGDGTSATAANAVVRAGTADNILVPAGFGRKNDAATSVYGRDLRSVAKILLENSEENATNVSLIQIKLDGEHLRYALSYASLGLTALGAEYFTSDEVRDGERILKGTLLDDVRLINHYLRTMRKDKTFRLNELDHTHYAGQDRHKGNDVLWINGSRIAGLNAAADYQTQGFLRREIPVPVDLNHVKLGKIALRVIWEHLHEGIDGEHRELRDQLEFDEPTSLLMQLDGEPIHRTVRKVTAEVGGSATILFPSKLRTKKIRSEKRKTQQNPTPNLRAA